MPRKDGSLTPTEQRFLDEYASSGNRAEAERKAKIAPRHGYNIIARPAVQAELVARQSARITADALPLAIDTICSIMRNANAPAGARVQAAKIVLDRALPSDETGQRKEIHEMSPEELAAAIANLESQAAALAKPVQPASDPGVFD